MEHVKKNARVPKPGIMLFCPTCKKDILVKHFSNFNAYCYECREVYSKTHFLIDPETSVKARKIRNGIFQEINKLTSNNSIIDAAKEYIYVFQDLLLVALFEDAKKKLMKLADGKPRCFNDNQILGLYAEMSYEKALEFFPNEMRKQKLLKIASKQHFKI